MNRLIITGYVGGTHTEVLARANEADAELLRIAASDIAERVGGVRTEAGIRRHGDVIELSTPGFDELDGAEIAFEPVGVESAGLTRLTVITRPAPQHESDRFLSAGLFAARAGASLQRAS
jgi:hypothetical protein